MRNLKSLAAALSAGVVLLGAMAGCRHTMPHAWWSWHYGGDMERSYAKPPFGVDNWDPWAASIELTPVEDTNPVRTQHVFVATVKDKEGKPLPNRRVEWIIASGSVGDFVEVDSNGWRASRGYKVDNHFAVTHTREHPYTLHTGEQDITLGTGQSWVVITSPIEGDTHITAYAPGIYDWTKHKTFAVKHWYDVRWEFPPPATNPTGTPHEFITKVIRASDGSPLAGYDVTYKIVDGPAGTFDPGGHDSVTVKTDGNGAARVVLNQARPAEGTNNVDIMIMRPENLQCCKPAVPIASGKTAKTWIGPKIAIQKDCASEKRLNEDFTYDIVVTNPSQVTTKDVVVTDPIPDGIVYVSSNPAGTVSGNTVTWNAGSLQGGGTWRAQITVKGTRKGTFENCADVRTAEGLTARDCCQTKISEAALVIEKTCTPEVVLCDMIEHTITVRNTGDAPATNVRVEDRLPDGMVTADGRTSLTFDGGTIEGGGAKQAKFTVKATKAGSYTNTATVTADGGLTATASCTTVVKTPALAITKSGPSERFIGRDAEYEITVSNRGDAPARDTILTDAVPAGATFVSASDGGAMGGGTVTWNLGTMPPGGSKTVKMVIHPTGAGTIHNVATAKAFCTDAQATHDMVVKGIPAVLLEVIDVDDPIEVGSQTTYVITVTNQGSAVGTNIKIVCQIPAEGEFVSGEGATRGTAAGGTVTFEPVPSLAPGAKVTFRVVMKAKAAGDVRFKTTMTTDQTGTVPIEETESTHLY
ncbi:MAG: DUF11 domain-containing protein [Phycisphaerae bacterium]